MSQHQSFRTGNYPNQFIPRAPISNNQDMQASSQQMMNAYYGPRPQQYNPQQTFIPFPMGKDSYPFQNFQFQQQMPMLKNQMLLPYPNPNFMQPRPTIIAPLPPHISQPKLSQSQKKIVQENGKDVIVIDSDEEFQFKCPEQPLVYMIPAMNAPQVYFAQNPMNFNLQNTMLQQPQLQPRLLETQHAPQPQLNNKGKKARKRNGKLQKPETDIKSRYQNQIKLIEKDPQGYLSRKILDMDQLERDGLIYEPEREKKRNKVLTQRISMQVRARMYSPDYSFLQPRKVKMIKPAKPKQDVLARQEITIVKHPKKKQNQIGQSRQAVLLRFKFEQNVRFVKRYDHKKITSSEWLVDSILQELKKAQPLANDEDVIQIITTFDYNVEKSIEFIKEQGPQIAYVIESHREWAKEEEFFTLPKKPQQRNQDKVGKLDLNNIY